MPVPVKRETLLALLRVAGYHADVASYTRLLIENRISKAAAREAYGIGQRMKAAGVTCSCHACNQA